MFQIHENKALSATILCLSVSVCDVGNKARISGRGVHCIINVCVWVGGEFPLLH